MKAKLYLIFLFTSILLSCSDNKNTVMNKVFHQLNRESKSLNVELFTWEELDYIDIIKKEFEL